MRVAIARPVADSQIKSLLYDPQPAASLELDRRRLRPKT